jgi:hypothetical protein
MDDAREIECTGDRRFTIRRFPDGTIGVFDTSGRLFVGWPETTVFGSRPLHDGTDAEWCALLGRIRKIA